MDYIDPVMASPNNYKTLFENDQVRVLEMNVKAGQSDITHSHPSETAYFISGGKARIHLPDGSNMEAEMPDGFVMYHDEWTHRVENLGNTDIKAIIVENKHVH